MLQQEEIHKAWVRAVWKEKQQEEEGIIPNSWLKGNYVFWPNGGNAEKALRGRREPGLGWRCFPLVKIKFQSDSYKECEEYNFTTEDLSELSDDEKAQRKRQPKKKQYADFVTDADETVTNQIQDNLQDAYTDDNDSEEEISSPLPKPPGKVHCGRKDLNNSTLSDKHGAKRPRLTINWDTSSQMRSRQDVTQTPSDRVHHNDTRFPLTQLQARCDQSQTVANDRGRLYKRSTSNRRDMQNLDCPDRRFIQTHSDRNRRDVRQFPVTESRCDQSLTVGNDIGRLSEQSTSNRRDMQNFDGLQARQDSDGDQGFSLIQARCDQSLTVGNDIGRLSEQSTSNRRDMQNFDGLQARPDSDGDQGFSLIQARCDQSLTVGNDIGRLSEQSTSNRRDMQNFDGLQARPDSDGDQGFSLIQARCDQSRTVGNDIGRLSEQSTSTPLDMYSDDNPRFPMTQARFQKRVLQLLLEIRSHMKKVPIHHSSNDEYHIRPASTLEEFLQLEERLEDADEQNRLKSYLRRLGGVTFVDHLKTAMLRTLSNNLMSKMNLDGRNDKMSFKNTKLYSVIYESVLSLDCKATEASFRKEIGSFLKYAPDRQGGSGRNKTI